MSNNINYINNINSAQLLDGDITNLCDINAYINKITKIYNNEESDIIEIKKGKKIENKAEQIIDEFHCKKCNENTIIEDSTHGIMVCKICGIVKSKIVNCTSDWNNYNDSKKEKSRTSHSISALLPQSSAATVISGSCSNRIKTLHNWQNMPYKERILNETFKLIQDACTQAGIPKCIEDEAKIKFKLISNCKHMSGKNIGKSVIIRGDNRKSLIAECLNEACNSKGLNRPPKELQKIFGTKHTKGRKIYQRLMETKNIPLEITFPKPDNFIIRFCDHLNLTSYYKTQSLKIANNVQKIKIASVHNSLSIATGSVFLMAHINNLNITKKIIASYFYVSQVTISKTFYKIEPFSKILINDDMCNIIEKEIEKYQKDILINDPINFIKFNVDTDKHLNVSKKKLLSIINKENVQYKKLLQQQIVLSLNKIQLSQLFMKKKSNTLNNMYELYFENIKSKFNLD